MKRTQASAVILLLIAFSEIQAIHEREAVVLEALRLQDNRGPPCSTGCGPIDYINGVSYGIGVCYPNTGQCMDCVNSADCVVTHNCETSTGNCVCDENSNCVGSIPYCVNRRCSPVQCTFDAPIYDANEEECVTCEPNNVQRECFSGPCSPEGTCQQDFRGKPCSEGCSEISYINGFAYADFTCNPNTNQCGDCQSNSNCFMTGNCETSTGNCICVTKDQCGDPIPYCVNMRCSPIQCEFDAPIYDANSNTCVTCQNFGNNVERQCAKGSCSPSGTCQQDFRGRPCSEGCTGYNYINNEVYGYYSCNPNSQQCGDCQNDSSCYVTGMCDTISGNCICNNDENCGGVIPYCQNRRCTPKICPFETPIYDANTNECVTCLPNAPNQERMCYQGECSAQGTCVIQDERGMECSEGCPGITLVNNIPYSYFVCNENTGQCGDCSQDNECFVTGNCETSTGNCICNNNEDCAKGLPFCVNMRCSPIKCTNPTPIYDANSGQCVACNNENVRTRCYGKNDECASDGSCYEKKVYVDK